MAASEAGTIETALSRLAPWILWPFVPSAAFFGAFGALLVALGIIWLISLASGPLSLALRPIAVGVVIYALIRCGVLCAPNSQRAVALMLATFPLALCAMFVLPPNVMPPSNTPPLSPMPIDSLEVDTPFVVPERLAWFYATGLAFFTLLGTIAAVVKSWRGDHEPAWPLPRRWSFTLRWVILGPATLLLAFLTFKWLGGPNGDPQYAIFIVLFSAAVFVLSATLIAPSNRLAIGICCVCLVAVVAISFAAFAHGQWQHFVFFKRAVALLAVAGAGIGLVAALTVRAASDHANVRPALGFFEGLGWGRRWTAIVTGVSALVGCILVLRAVCFPPVAVSVFSPPAGWHRFPQIPLVAPSTQLGRWTDGQGTIWVFSMADTVRPGARLTTDSFGESHNYGHFRLESARIISICGAHPALIQSFHGLYLGDDTAVTELFTIWGTTVYRGFYARSPSTRPDAGAVAALQSLCAGDAAQRPSSVASMRPSKTGKNH